MRNPNYPDSTLNSNMSLRRAQVRLPSIWAHVFWAIAALIVLCVGMWVYMISFGTSDARLPERFVQIDPQPQPPESDTLAGRSGALPDLLDGDVPQGVNPTTLLSGETSGPTVDALGNPLNSLGGSLQTGQNGQSQDQRIIRINGRAVTTAASLPAAPIAGLTRQGTYGPVPNKSQSGETALRAYKKPYAKTAGLSPVSIVIGGLGINRGITQQAITTLPPEVTLSFAAHAPNLQSWINQARAAGHEVLLEVPMEASNFDPSEPGADRALKSDKTQDENLNNLDWLLSRGQGYFGITNFNGDRFLSRTDAVVPVIAHLSQAGLSFIFDGSSSAPSLSLLTSGADLPYEQAYTLLDGIPDRSNIEIELSRLQAQASAGAGAVGFGFAYPQTLSAVNNWTRSLQTQQLELAPASSVLP